MSALNTRRTRGWMKNSWLKNANGKFTQTSFTHIAASAAMLKP